MKREYQNKLRVYERTMYRNFALSLSRKISRMCDALRLSGEASR